MGQAILSIINNGEPQDLNVIWRRGYDDDAVINVPAELRAQWSESARSLASGNYEGGFLKPYPTLPTIIHVSQLNRSASGFYKIAWLTFDEARWKVSPPYPEVPPLQPGDIA